MEIIKKNKKILAMILRKNYKNKGLKFFTPPDFSQQIAYMSYNKGKLINCHFHRNISRKTLSTQEVLIIKSGKLKVLLFDKKKYFCTKILNTGDIILLANCGHGFKTLKKTSIVEVKQGPYNSKKDKIIFNSKKLN